MKKILLISNRVMHYRVGVYNYFYKRFKEEGYDFSVFTNELQKQNTNPVDFNLKIIPFKFDLYKKEIKKLKPDYIILFLHLKNIIIFPLLYWLKFKKIPVLFWTKGANLEDINNKIKKIIFQHIHNKADGLILYSQKEINLISKKNLHKVTYANNTINFNDFPQIKESVKDIKKEFNIPFKKVALFVGRMDIGGGRKKVDHAIEIFNKINNTEYGLVIVGSGLSDELKSRLNPNNIKYLGEVHDSKQIQISKIFKMADLFLMPGHVGLGLNQAFYWGLPVLTEEGNQPPEVHYLINNRNGFMVKEDDIEELKKKILYLLENDKIREEFSKNAKNDIMENASIENMFQGFLQNIKKSDKQEGKK